MTVTGGEEKFDSEGLSREKTKRKFLGIVTRNTQKKQRKNEEKKGKKKEHKFYTEVERTREKPEKKYEEHKNT